MQVDIDMSAAGKLPALWSAEEPNLYILVLSLVTKQGEHIDSESSQVMHCSFWLMYKGLVILFPCVIHISSRSTVVVVDVLQ